MHEASAQVAAEPVIALEGVKRWYEVGSEIVHALDGVTFHVDRGEFLALAGPSGSGKSTLLNLIGGLDRPTEGKVYVAGRELGVMTQRELALMRRDHIGFVFQAYNLIPVLSAIENVEYVMVLQGVPRAQRRERARAILDEVGLGSMVNRRPTELSGGQQQRVAVARALAAQPALLLADEPTANLDSTTGDGLLDMMAELNQRHGATFVFSTHDRRIMERASRLVTLRDGRVVSDERR